jgi:hypothetical protein
MGLMHKTTWIKKGSPFHLISRAMKDIFYLSACVLMMSCEATCHQNTGTPSEAR